MKFYDNETRKKIIKEAVATASLTIGSAKPKVQLTKDRKQYIAEVTSKAYERAMA